MKRLFTGALLGIVTLFCIAATEAQGGWYFTNSARTVITNEAGWAFGVTVDTVALSVTVGACSGSPGAAGVLDFSGDVDDSVNGTGDTYAIVSVGTGGTTSILGSHIAKAQGLVLPNSLSNITQYVFYNCTSLTGNLAIPNGVTNIGQYAFNNCRFSGGVTIPDSVTSLGSGAFSNCTSFTGNLVIGDGLTTINATTFMNCTNFTGTLTLGKNLVTIGDRAFNGCTFTGDLIIPDKVTTIGNRVFNLDNNTTGKMTFHGGKLHIGDGVTSIGEYAFSSCIFTNLYIGKGITILQHNVYLSGGANNNIFSGAVFDMETLYLTNTTLKVIGNAFYNAAAANRAIFTNSANPSIGTSLVIGGGVTNIIANAFNGCPGLTGTLTLGTNLVSIGNSAFKDCKFKGSLDIPDSVISMGDSAFNGCTFNGSLIIGDGITNINASAFASVPFTGDLTIGDGVTNIAANAFQSCGFTGRLTLGKNIESIGNYAFESCPFRSDLIIPDKVKTIGNDVFSHTGVSIQRGRFGGTLHIGEGLTSIGGYAFADCTFTNVYIGAGVTSLNHTVGNAGNTLFASSTFDMETLAFPETLKNIGNAFGGTYKAFFTNSINPALGTSLVISNGVTNIVADAFSGVTGLTGTLTLGTNLVSIGNSAFNGCKFTGDLDIPDSVLSIGTSAFNATTFPGSLTLGAGLSNIVGNAFSGVPFAGTLTLGANVTNIAASAFENCRFTGDLAITGKVVSIGGGAFRNGTVSQFGGSLTLGDSVTSIGDLAFYNATFTNLAFGAGYTNFNNRIFYNAKLHPPLIAFPDTVKNIGDDFASVTSFSGTSLDFGNGVANIASGAFQSRSGLTGTVTFGTNLVTIGSTAFSGCGLTGSPAFKEGLRNIAANAFHNTKFTGGLHIPGSVTNIGSSAFLNVPFAGALTFGESGGGAVSELKSIGNDAFENCTFTGDLVLPHSARSIGGNAFRNGTVSQFGGKLRIGDGVTSIGDLAFYNATFTGITFGTGYTNFDNRIFFNAKLHVPLLAFPDTVKYIGDDFANVTSFSGTSIAIGNGVTNIASSAFANKAGLTGTLTLGTNLVTIGQQAFNNCKFTGNLKIPDSVKTIGTSAFNGVPFGGVLHIGDGVTSIGTQAFNGDKFTGHPYFGKGLVNISNNAFQYVTFTADPLILPDHILSIGTSAFEGATFGGTVVIGDNVTNIGSRAFYYCPGLARISLPSTEVSLGANAFSQNTATLKEVYYRSGYPTPNGIYNGGNSITSYVTQAWAEDVSKGWTNKGYAAITPAGSLTNGTTTAMWQSRPIRIGEWQAPNVIYLDPLGGLDGSTYAYILDGEIQTAGLIAPRRDGIDFLGYWDGADISQYLTPSMASLVSPFDLPYGSTLYAHWYDPHPEVQWLAIEAIDILPSGDVRLSWRPERIKYEYDEVPYTVTVYGTTDLASGFLPRVEGVEVFINGDSATLPATEDKMGFFKAKAEAITTDEED